MSAPDATTDPELEAVAWDLTPLLDDGAATPAPPSTRCSPPPRSAPTRSPPRTPARSTSSTARACVALMRELARAAGARGPRRLLRDPELLRQHRRPRPRRAAAAHAGEGDRDRDRAAVLRARVGRARRRARRGAARHRRPGLRPPPPALRAPLPPAPALRARGADLLRARADRPHGVDAAVRGAGVGDHRRAARRDRAGLARGRDGAAVLARPRACGATPPSGSRTALAARPAHARVRVQHAAGGQDGRGPAAQVPELARQPQPRQRGLRRVGRRR